MYLDVALHFVSVVAVNGFQCVIIVSLCAAPGDDIVEVVSNIPQTLQYGSQHLLEG